MLHAWEGIGQKTARYSNFCVAWLKKSVNGPPTFRDKITPMPLCKSGPGADNEVSTESVVHNSWDNEVSTESVVRNV